MSEEDKSTRDTESRTNVPCKVRAGEIRALALNGYLPDVVEALCSACRGEMRSVLKGPRREALPSRAAIADIVESLRSVLFPGYFGTAELNAASMKFYMGATLDRVLRALQEQIRRGLCFVCPQTAFDKCGDCESRAVSIAQRFVESLASVQRQLIADIAAAYCGDPAAPSSDEAVFCYPGPLAVTNYRLAHELYTLEVPLIPRMITEHAHGLTGIDIHPGAQIGESFFIDHGTGVVIGETAVIGNRVRLYQGVTLGARSFPLDDKGNPVKGIARHPIVEDDVVIYAGATILGRVTIGHGSEIGGNVWLTRSVPPHSRISQAQARLELFGDGTGI